MIEPPKEPLFEGANIVIINNGACFSACDLFSVSIASCLRGANVDLVQDPSEENRRS